MIRLHWLPTTGPGRWSLALLLAFLVSVPLNFVIEGAGRIAGWTLPLSAALAILAISLRGERAVLVIAAVLFVLFVLGFELVEFVSTH